MIKRVMHPSDFSKASGAAFAKAVETAKANRAELAIVHVLAPVMPIAGDGYVSPAAYDEMARSARAWAQKKLDALVDKAKSAKVRAKGVLLEGVAHDQIVRAAKHRLPAGEWDYLTGGTETETTMRRNRLALDTIALRPRVLRNVSKVDATSTFLGRPVRIPVMFAPIGSIESFTPGGGATAAQASAEFGVPQMLSSVCSPGLEAVAKAADNFRIFQLYVRGDDAFVDDHVRRALAHGYAAFCLTVDTAWYSQRSRPMSEVLPWDHVNVKKGREYLEKEQTRSLVQLEVMANAE